MSAMLSRARRALRRWLESLGAGQGRRLSAFEDPARQRFDREYEALLIQTANACPEPRRRWTATH
jgi:hypothetical protein